MHLIDSHCHLDFPEFDHDRDEVLGLCRSLGVTDIVVPGTTVDSWRRLLELCEKNPSLHPALGLHPMFMEQHPEDAVTRLEQAITEHRPVAIGEIGLDFYLPDHDKQAQTALFEAQLKLAEKFELPVILHVRKAHDQVLKLLRKRQICGVVHAFGGSQQQAEQYQTLGFVFGVGGALTYQRANKLQQLFRDLPEDSIVLETDSPDMPLSGKQGQRNSPENIPLVLKKLAEIRGQSEQELAASTTRNCRRLFGF